DTWRRVERQLKQVVVAVGCFGLTDIEASGGEDLAEIIEATLASGDVVGATIARHAQPHRARRRNP
ncbi:MAG: hypothetical protein M3N47_11745, partial [Chloroflexota bacterium]|nr:hypothetical protein [Chloroflexota bacterium]